MHGHIVLEKEDYDISSNQNVKEILERLKPARFAVFGVATDYCIRTSALALRSRDPRCHGRGRAKSDRCDDCRGHTARDHSAGGRQMNLEGPLLTSRPERDPNKRARKVGLLRFSVPDAEMFFQADGSRE